MESVSLSAFSFHAIHFVQHGCNTTKRQVQWLKTQTLISMQFQNKFFSNMSPFHKKSSALPCAALKAPANEAVRQFRAYASSTSLSVSRLSAGDVSNGAPDARQF